MQDPTQAPAANVASIMDLPVCYAEGKSLKNAIGCY